MTAALLYNSLPTSSGRRPTGRMDLRAQQELSTSALLSGIRRRRIPELPLPGPSRLQGDGDGEPRANPCRVASISLVHSACPLSLWLGRLSVGLRKFAGSGLLDCCGLGTCYGECQPITTYSRSLGSPAGRELGKRSSSNNNQLAKVCLGLYAEVDDRAREIACCFQTSI